MATIQDDRKAFAAALREMYKRPEIAEARRAMLAARKTMLAAYETVCIEHWKQRGNRASTGWGRTPEGKYQSSREPRGCARHLAEDLWAHFAVDPQRPPREAK